MAHHWIATRPGGLDVFSFEEYDVPAPQHGEVTIAVRAAGMNPADAKHVASGAGDFPRAIGYEVAGVVSAVGPDTEIASGPVAVGDEVLAFRISGGWATDVTVPARGRLRQAGVAVVRRGRQPAARRHDGRRDAARHRRRPRATRSWCTARPGPSASACSSRPRCIGARVVGTASPASHDVVTRVRRRAGGVRRRARAAGARRSRPRAWPRRSTASAPTRRSTCPSPWSPTADASSRSRPPTAPARRASPPSPARCPASQAYRASVRADLVERAGAGPLVVPVARSFPLADAARGRRAADGPAPRGKLVLEP